MAAETAVPPQPCARVMLVDGFALVRSAFRRVLQAEADIEVAVEAADAAEAISFIRAMDVDVVVIGMSMHGAMGVGLASRILDCKADARVLLLSQSREPHWVKRAFDAGVRGFLFMKHAVDADFTRAVRTVAAGESYISPELSGLLIRAVRAGVLGSSDPYDRLTRREKQVLQLIAQGKSAREIARVLGLSINTVAVHRAKAMNRLGIHKTAGLVMFAVERGLVMMD
jgi:DNA-binding NarL/FixJ family response regulator